MQLYNGVVFAHKIIPLANVSVSTYIALGPTNTQVIISLSTEQQTEKEYLGGYSLPSAINKRSATPTSEADYTFYAFAQFSNAPTVSTEVFPVYLSSLLIRPNKAYIRTRW